MYYYSSGYSYFSISNIQLNKKHLLIKIIVSQNLEKKLELSYFDIKLDFQNVEHDFITVKFLSMLGLIFRVIKQRRRS